MLELLSNDKSYVLETDHCATLVLKAAQISAASPVRYAPAVRRTRWSSLLGVSLGHQKRVNLEAVSSLDHSSQKSCPLDTFRLSLSAISRKENPPSSICIIRLDDTMSCW
ncbi:hypothetical protein TNCV_520561 [Trichonephila clavipes]|nr:hypothetical protein TNCV_520561 [Trichonephila clavipes]